MPAKRFQVPYLGEYYSDELRIEAVLKNRTEPQEAQSLLCSTIMRRSEVRQKMIEVLARKRGITPDELRTQILSGNYEPLEPDEIIILDDEDSEE